MTDFKTINDIAREIAELLEEKSQFYGDSWRKRGGPGAFMVMARKWDRIENICAPLGYNIFKALDAKSGDIEDDIRDLIGYLLLILEAATPTHKDFVKLNSVASSEKIEGYDLEGFYGDETNLYKCKSCKSEVRAKPDALLHTCTLAHLHT